MSERRVIQSLDCPLSLMSIKRVMVKFLLEMEPLLH